MDDERQNLDEDIEELLDRAENNDSSNEEKTSEDEELMVNDADKFNGYFHERDSLAENNIVD